MTDESVHQGRFVAFEGGEACGKSTQARLLADALDAVLTREPGGTEIGSALRGLVLSPTTVGFDARAEALVMAADRAQHVAQIVRPALAAGRHVVTDRFAGSSIAYQAYGRGLPVEEIRSLSDWATDGCWPDLVVLLVVPPSVAQARLERELDRLEAEGAEFHARVGAGFRRQAEADPDRWVVVDGTASVEAVHLAVRTAVRERLQLPV